MFTNFIYVAGVYFTIGMNSTTDAADCVVMATVYVLIYATLLEMSLCTLCSPRPSKKVYLHAYL